MKKIKKFWPVIFLFIVWGVLFWPFISKKLLPIPADIITGVYFPWLDYKWGFITGVPVKNPLISDIPSILYPWRSLAIDQIKSFQWPLWNPYYFTGMPLLANFQSAVFSYVNIFFFFFSKPIAWSFGVMVSPVLTMLLMYAYLKNRKLENISALLGSVVFSLSGFEIAWLEYNVHGHTALFLPLYLLITDKILRDKKYKYLLLLPLSIAFQIFSGYIPVVIYSAVICIFYVLFFYLIPDLRSKQKNFWKYFLMFVFAVWGIIMSAIQLFPGIELTNLSIRLIDPIVSASNASYLPLKNLLTMIAPDFFGNPATGNYFGTAFYDNFYFFAGTGTLIFVIFSFFFAKKQKEILFWILILIFSFVLVIKNPLGLILEKILFLSGGVASKALFISDFALAILAGFGMNNFLTNDFKNRKKIIFSLLPIIVLFLIAIYFSFNIVNIQNKLVSQKNLIIPLIVFFLSAFICLLSLLRKQFCRLFENQYFFGILILIGTTAQLLYSANKYLPFSKEHLLFPKTPVIDFLINESKRSSEPFRVEIGNVIPQNFLMPYGIEASSGYDALLPKRSAQFLSLVEMGKIEERLSRVWLINNYDSKVFPLLNTKYILAKKTDQKGIYSPEGSFSDRFKDSRYKIVFEDKTIGIFEDSKYLPRAFWVYDYVVNIKDGEFLSNIKSEKDLNKKISIESFTNEVLRTPGGVKDGEVRWLLKTPNKFILEVESTSPGYIFISQGNFPGWKAYVNDKEEIIYRANISFNSVFVPAGKNLLTFQYFPKAFSLGIAVTFFAIINWFLLIFILLLKNLYVAKKK